MTDASPQNPRWLPLAKLVRGLCLLARRVFNFKILRSSLLEYLYIPMSLRCKDRPMHAVRLTPLLVTLTFQLPA